MANKQKPRAASASEASVENTTEHVDISGAGGDRPNVILLGEASEKKGKPGKRKVREKMMDTENKGKERAEEETSKGDDALEVCSCGKEVKDNQSSIECEICSKWFHPDCQNLNSEALKAIGLYDLFWMCGSCKKFSGIFRDVVSGSDSSSNTNSRLDLLEAQMRDVNQMRKKMDDLNGMMDNIAKSLIGQREMVSEIGLMVKEKWKAGESGKEIENSVRAMKDEAATYADMVKKLTNKLEKEGLNKPTTQVRELRHAVTDCLEQDKRRRNIVVFNVKEQDAGLNPDEQCKADHHSFVELMKTGLKLVIHPEKVVRVGKLRDERPRLMVVTLQDERDKWELLKMAKSLRYAGDRFKNIYVAPDLSPAEQEKDRNLRKELRERKEAGEDVIIYRGRVMFRADRPGTQRVNGASRD